MNPNNSLLESLPADDWQRWQPYFQYCEVPIRKQLYGLDEAIDYLWFPEDGVFSQVIEGSRGGSVEVAVIGFEGMIGLPAVFGARKTPTRVVAQTPASALRIRIDDFFGNLCGDDPLLRRLERYAAVRLSVLAQIAGCNRLHRTEQRLCRWLLMVHDRARCDRLPMTHEFLALMLGTRRAAVTEVAHQLQQEGLIHYERGTIEFANRAGLEARACECYDAIRSLYAALETSTLQLAAKRI